MTSRGYIILNIIRVISIIALCLAITASITTLAKSFKLSRVGSQHFITLIQLSKLAEPSVLQFFLFDILNNFILAIFCLLLLFSEISMFSTYYERRWPLLGPQSSLVGIGVAEMIVGLQLLGMMNDDSPSEEPKETIIISLNAVLLSAGIIIETSGLIVFISSYVYSNSMTHTTARTVRSRAHNTSRKEPPKPVLVLERVITEPESIERPQRSYSQSSRIAPQAHGLERAPSASSWVPMKLGGLERSGSAASGINSRGPYPYATTSRTMTAGIHDRSYSKGSEAGASSVYSSKPPWSDYEVNGNPYAKI